MYNGQKIREIIFFFLFSNIDKTATIFSLLNRITDSLLLFQISRSHDSCAATMFLPDIRSNL